MPLICIQKLMGWQPLGKIYKSIGIVLKVLPCYSLAEFNRMDLAKTIHGFSKYFSI